MARRKREVATNGRQDHEQPFESEGETLGVLPVATASVEPSIEDRLARLEAELSESSRIIRQQAGAIAIGVEHTERLRKSRERVSKLEATADDAKKAASEAKKSYEAAVSDHFSLEKELDSGQARLPFPDEAVPPAQPVAEAVTDSPTDDESWRRTHLDSLELSASIIDKLHESEIRTVGDLSDYLKPNAAGSCKRLIDLPGIGEVKAEAIEEALMLFWGHHHAAMAMDPDLDVDATLQAGCEAAEARRAGEDEADAMHRDAFDQADPTRYADDDGYEDSERDGGLIDPSFAEVDD